MHFVHVLCKSSLTDSKTNCQRLPVSHQPAKQDYQHSAFLLMQLAETVPWNCSEFSALNREVAVPTELENMFGKESHDKQRLEPPSKHRKKKLHTI